MPEKADNLHRCWLQVDLGDALRAISCAAGYNLRWLMRAILHLGIGPLFFAPVALCITATTHRAYGNCLAIIRHNPLVEKFDCRSANRKIRLSSIPLGRFTLKEFCKADYITKMKTSDFLNTTYMENTPGSACGETESYS